MSEGLPEQLREWLEWAERFKTADLYNRQDYRDLILQLTDDEIAKMGEVYKKAQHDDSIQVLKRWLISHRGEAPMSHEELAIRNLLHLWRRLNSQACVPFSKGPVLDVGWDFRPTPDWSKLPVDMRFLAEAAEMCSKFTYSSSDEGRENIVRTTTNEEREMLEAVAVRVRETGYKKIKEWASPLILYHTEAHLVSNLISVLDALNLPYYNPKE